MTPERVLERDYARLRPATLAAVRSKLRAAGISYPEQDLEAFYNQAWHALYERMVAGEEIANLTGFLVLVAYRRAVDDFRRLRPDERAELDAATLSSSDDVVERLDDQRRLREFIEALRDELGERERVAASLCYVHGYSRSEAAEVMGLSPGRMKKVMDDVSRTVARFTAQIRAGERCEVGASRTKAYALGLLDPDGERYRAARAHLDECPACRAEVLRLRGLAAIATPALLPWVKLAAAGGGAAAGAEGATGGPPRPRGDRASRTAAVAAAAAVVVAIAVAGTVTLSRDEERAGATAADQAGASSPSGSASASSGSSSTAARARRAHRAERPRPERAAERRASPAAPERRDAGQGGRSRDAAPASAPATPASAPAAASTAAPAPVSAPAPAPAPTPTPTPAPAAAPTPVSVPPAPPSPPPSAASQPVDESGVQEFGLEP